MQVKAGPADSEVGSGDGVAGLQHDPDGGIGVFGEVAATRGIAVHEHFVPSSGPPAPDVEFGALIVLGGRMNASDADELAWLSAELRLISALLEPDVPLLGGCLGAQLLCVAAGGRTRRATVPEIGWPSVRLLAAAADDPLLRDCPTDFPALSWHGWEAIPSAGAVPLAESEVRLQAFRAGDRAWGRQFHPESQGAELTSWIEAAPDDANARAVGFDPCEARSQMKTNLAAWNAFGRGLANRFFDLAFPNEN
ncbi:MAG: type 1 glutamine amidotransferase [Solirubrobacterales bacterium]